MRFTWHGFCWAIRRWNLAECVLRQSIGRSGGAERELRVGLSPTTGAERELRVGLSPTTIGRRGASPEPATRHVEPGLACHQ